MTDEDVLKKYHNLRVAVSKGHRDVIMRINPQIKIIKSSSFDVYLLGYSK